MPDLLEESWQNPLSGYVFETLPSAQPPSRAASSHASPYS